MTGTDIKTVAEVKSQPAMDEHAHFTPEQKCKLFCSSSMIRVHRSPQRKNKKKQQEESNISGLGGIFCSYLELYCTSFPLSSIPDPQFHSFFILDPLPPTPIKYHPPPTTLHQKTNHFWNITCHNTFNGLFKVNHLNRCVQVPCRYQGCFIANVGYVRTCQTNKSWLPQDTRWLCLHLPTKQITTASRYTLAMSAPANQTNHNCLMIHVGYVHTCQTNKSWWPHDTRWLCLHLPTKQIMTASWYTLAMSAPANQITTAHYTC